MQPCSACGKSTSDTAQFCEHCGAPVAAPPSANVELANRVKRLLAEGRKIEAIKVLREATGAGLAEAKDAVEAIERGEVVEAARVGHAFEGELLTLLEAGQKIEAIKRHRARTSCGLKEAKEFVEALAERHNLPVSRGGCAGVVLALVIAFILTAACIT